MAKRLFVAATGQHRGKTTCTLGIVAALVRQGINVGYCKPVGQRHLSIRGKMTDKDAVLFEEMLQFEVNPDIHSPVIIASGVTAKYIDDPSQFNFREDIEFAADYLEKNHDYIVYEGTGHAGVGSIADLSNAQVAKMLDAEVIIVCGGGIGNTFDRLNLNLSIFRELNVPVKGVIVNKVLPDKLEHVRYYLEKRLAQINIPVLGVLPFDQTLSFPLMGTVVKAVKGKMIRNSHKLYNQVEEILAGSSLEIDEFTVLRNVLLIVNQAYFKEAIQKIKSKALELGIEEAPLSGVIVTGDGKQDVWDDKEDITSNYLEENQIPVLTTKYDTYDTVVRISRIEVKINTHTPWKVRRAIELLQENMDVEGLF